MPISLSFVSGLKPESLSADLTTFVKGRKVDDNVNVMLRSRGAQRHDLGEPSCGGQ